MNPERKTEWLAALRSGEYHQTTGALRTEGSYETDDHEGHCCLGVLCDLYARDTGADWSKGTGTCGGKYSIHNAYDILPREVVEWAGLQERELLGTSDPGQSEQERNIRIHLVARLDINTLAEANDEGFSFDLIADVIEAQL